MRTRIILLAGLCAVACTTEGNSGLIITKVVPPTVVASTTPGGPNTCSFSASTDESSFLAVNLSPGENIGNVAAVVQNLIPPTNSSNPTLNLDAATFLPHQAVVRYEFIYPAGATGSATPRNNPTIIAVGGLQVPGGVIATMGVPMFLPGAITGTIPAGTFIRATFHIEGKLLGGTITHTSEREYLFEVCTTPGCANNACL